MVTPLVVGRQSVAEYWRDRSRRRDWVEILVGYGLILAVIWTPSPYQQLVYWVPVVWIAGGTWLSFKSCGGMGWRVTNLLGSLWVVGVALVLAGIALAVSARVGALHAPAGVGLLVRTYIGYMVWSFAQQFLIMDFLLWRLLRLMTPKWAVLLAATVFALTHVPNPVLFPLTMVWGLVACVVFVKYRNLWSLGMAHAILGICVAVSFPVRLTHNMRVGTEYLRFQSAAEMGESSGVERVGGAGRGLEMAQTAVAQAVRAEDAELRR
jgi:membrane protease YdiL (CAAX protease family)